MNATPRRANRGPAPPAGDCICIRGESATASSLPLCSKRSLTSTRDLDTRPDVTELNSQPIIIITIIIIIIKFEVKLTAKCQQVSGRFIMKFACQMADGSGTFPRRNRSPSRRTPTLPRQRRQPRGYIPVVWASPRLDSLYMDRLAGDPSPAQPSQHGATGRGQGRAGQGRAWAGQGVGRAWAGRGAGRSGVGRPRARGCAGCETPVCRHDQFGHASHCVLFSEGLFSLPTLDG